MVLSPVLVPAVSDALMNGKMTATLNNGTYQGFVTLTASNGSSLTITVTMLAGSPGIYSLFTCSDPKSPAVAEVSSALTKDAVLIGFTGIAPLADYCAALAAYPGAGLLVDDAHGVGVLGHQSPVQSPVTSGVALWGVACSIAPSFR